jgi:hypothetical protein
MNDLLTYHEVPDRSCRKMPDSLSTVEASKGPLTYLEMEADDPFLGLDLVFDLDGIEVLLDVAVWILDHTPN